MNTEDSLKEHDDALRCGGKLFYVGHLGYGSTSKMRCDDLQSLGLSVRCYDSEQPWIELSRFNKLRNKVLPIHSVKSIINREILQGVEEFSPDIFWADKQEHLFPSTIRYLKSRGIRTVHYTPDPYFSVKWKRTRSMDECFGLFDLVVTTKAYELDMYRSVCRNVLYQSLGFSSAVHRPCFDAEDSSAAGIIDIGFVGGWEPRREEYLTRLVRSGGRLKIWGYYWDHLKDGRWSFTRARRLRRVAAGERFRVEVNDDLAPLIQTEEVHGHEYAKILSRTRISIGFLRRSWPDQHTTRTFEIPACGSLLLADRTPEHEALFKEGVEAEFFSSVDELIDKALFYQENEIERKRIADAGLQRCRIDGYSYMHRLREILAALG